MVNLNQMFYLGMYFLQWQLMPPDDISVSEDQIFCSLSAVSESINIDHIKDFKFVEPQTGRNSQKGLRNLNF